MFVQHLKFNELRQIEKNLPSIHYRWANQETKDLSVLSLEFKDPSINQG